MTSNSNLPTNSPENPPRVLVLDWDLFPVRVVIARGTFAIVALWLVFADLNSGICALFACMVMDLLKDCLDVFEETRQVKTGIFKSSLKYFLFWDGGVAIIWLLTRIFFPHGMKNITGLLLWVVVIFLQLLILNSASRAASRRMFKSEQQPGN